MGKILPKRKYFKSTIYRPNFDVGSHIDNVKYSLEHLIFSNAKETESNLLKKRIKVIASVTILLMVVSSFFSPKGKAEIATFYPTACLGGWNNPHNAEGEPQVISNSNESDFNDTNSALLLAGANADIYCGNFVGTIEENTKPVKMLVSFSWSKSGVVTLEKHMSGDLSASSSMEILDTASTTVITLSSENATSSLNEAVIASSTENSSSTFIDLNVQEVNIGTSTETKIEGSSLVDKVIDMVSNVVGSLFGGNNDTATQSNATSTIQNNITPEAVSDIDTSTSSTQSVEAPSTVASPVSTEEKQKEVMDANQDVTLPVDPAPSTEPASTQAQEPVPVVVPESKTEPVLENQEVTPVSFLNTFIEKITTSFVRKVFAEEENSVVAGDLVHTTTTPQVVSETIIEKTISQESTVLDTINEIKDITVVPSITTEDIVVYSSSSSVVASSSEVELTSTSTPAVVSSSTNTAYEEMFQNDFLEVYYTFDGVTWLSLGRVSEQSLKYRTFEIPVTASTSWEDMSKLQLKVGTLERVDAKPTLYLDGIKVEVLYESTVVHEHPDFVRDTILQDEIVGDIRIIRIINNDTNLEEIWYVRQEHKASSTVEVATSTIDIATSTEMSTTTERTSLTNLSVASGTQSTMGTTTDNNGATSDRVIRPDSLKNKWIKLDVVEVSSKDVSEIVKDIEDQEEKQEFIIPDFTKDFIKKVQGSFLHAIVVQIEQEGKDSLWVFDVEKNTQEKIDNLGKTTFSKTYPFGMKDDTVFWLSEDKTIVFSYNVITKIIDQKEIPPYDISSGERGIVFFDTIPWKIIVGADQFSFYSEETGEVFSDDNLNAGEAFRVKEKLDTVLTKEELGNLNFITESNVIEE